MSLNEDRIISRNEGLPLTTLNRKSTKINKNRWVHVGVYKEGKSRPAHFVVLCSGLHRQL